jgi:hypothetical protein
MNPTQIRNHNESLRYCEKLLADLGREKDTAAECFRGEPLKEYLKATEEATAKVLKIRDSLRSLQEMQQRM